jgi:hypothetical protein
MPTPTNTAYAVSTRGRRDRQNTIRLRSIAGRSLVSDH